MARRDQISFSGGREDSRVQVPGFRYPVVGGWWLVGGWLAGGWPALNCIVGSGSSRPHPAASYSSGPLPTQAPPSVPPRNGKATIWSRLWRRLAEPGNSIVSGHGVSWHVATKSAFPGGGRTRGYKYPVFGTRYPVAGGWWLVAGGWWWWLVGGWWVAGGGWPALNCIVGSGSSRPHPAASYSSGPLPTQAPPSVPPRNGKATIWSRLWRRLAEPGNSIVSGHGVSWHVATKSAFPGGGRPRGYKYPVPGTHPSSFILHPSPFTLHPSPFTFSPSALLILKNLRPVSRWFAHRGGERSTLGRSLSFGFNPRGPHPCFAKWPPRCCSP